MSSQSATSRIGVGQVLYYDNWQAGSGHGTIDLFSHLPEGQSWNYSLTMQAPGAIILPMNSKHRKVLNAIFTKPTLSTIRFCDIELLLTAIGASVAEGNGSRVTFSSQGEEWHAHRPHPGKEAKKYQIEGVRDFLTRLEILP